MLAQGDKLGQFEILARLGAGGMGEVYRARDTKLNRDVALKVLPEALAKNADRMARFQREAQVLASLNHPNIGSIYGLEESGGVRALVMELVEGPTLAERIAGGVAPGFSPARAVGAGLAPPTGKGTTPRACPERSEGGARTIAPIPLDESLDIAKQIAEALEYAHERGVVHRDLKPANIKITHDNQVKVLDFGLAKALDPQSSASGMGAIHESPLQNSPTLSMAATQEGVILGTAAYMAPEQAKGKPVDRRADIWAFGCVLYEVLTGKHAFEGETVSDVLAAVIMKDPDWTMVPESTPASIRKLLRRCLEKNPRGRLQAIGEARIAIEETLGGERDVAPGFSPARADPSLRSGQALRVGATGWRRALPWGIVGLVLGALMAGALLLVERPQAPPRRIHHLSITLPPGLSISDTDFTELALSPDGTNLVFSARQGDTGQHAPPPLAGAPLAPVFSPMQGDKIQLYRRRMEETEATPIAGTDGGVAPFFSPDGASVAFLTETASRGTPALKKIPLAGGPVQSLCTTYNNYQGSWSTDGTIFFANSHFGGLARVSSAGGSCQDLTTPERGQGELAHLMPQVLPGGESLLFTFLRFSYQGSIAVLSLKTGKWQTLIHDGSNPRYVPAGYLVYTRSGSLMAVPFDLASLKVTGSPVPVVDDVMTSLEGSAAQFAFALDGTLAYIAGHGPEATGKVVLVDRNGQSQVLTQSEGAYEDLAVSPDGHRVALTVMGATWHIWIYDIPRGTLTRFTFENDNRDPVWTSDGKRVAYSSFRNGKYGIYWKPADGSGPEELLLSSPDWVWAGSFSPDGKDLAYIVRNPETGFDIWILPLEGDRKPRPFARTQFNEWSPAFSPDGHWLAYESDESGRYEVYVQPYPGPGGKWQISNDGGSRPIWSTDGRELFYRNDNKLMAVPIETKPSFAPGTPHLLSEGNYFVTGHYYDVMPGGKQFLFIKETERPHTSTEINVVLNWFDELKRLMAAQKQ